MKKELAAFGRGTKMLRSSQRPAKETERTEIPDATGDEFQI